jgi:hypothetical protein
VRFNKFLESLLFDLVHAPPALYTNKENTARAARLKARPPAVQAAFGRDISGSITGLRV